MADRTSRAGGVDDLAPREIELLRSIVRHHISTGEPVGSRKIRDSAQFDLSPASIRAMMADLAQRGWLSQPHTSAGRVPTDKAYRLHVDQVLERRQSVAPSQARTITAALGRRGREVDDLLGEASRQLSSCSNHVGLVLAPDVRRIIVDQLEFVRLDEHRLMAILVARSGVVHHRMLLVDETLDQSELERIGRYLSDHFGGHTLPRMQELLRRKMQEEQAAVDRWIAYSLDLGRQAVEPGVFEGAVFVEGASNLLASPEFADVDAVRRVYRALEEKGTLIDLLSRVLDGQGVQVVIGEEHARTDLARCSLVASSYGMGGRTMGTVGIVGPTRMHYARTIGLVDFLARALSRFLSGDEN